MRRPPPRTWRVMLAACLLLPLAACAAPAGPPASSKAPPAPATASAALGAAPAAAAPAATGSVVAPRPEPAKVRLGVSNLVGEAAIYAALDKGYFAEQAIEVELITSTQTTDVIPALTTGELDLAASTLHPGFFNAAERAIPIKVVAYLAVITARSVSGGLVVRQDHVDSGRYREPADLKGMLVAISSPPGGATDFFLERFAGLAGITLPDMPTTVVPFPQMAIALANKAVDASYNVEPFIGVAEQQGTAKFVVPNGHFLPGVPVFVLQISPVFARAQPQVADRFLAALLKGQRFNYDAVTSGQGAEELYGIVQNYTPIKDTRLLARMLTDVVPPDGIMDTTPLADIQDAFIRYGTVQQRLDLAQLVDPSYAARAIAQLGR
jgi:NitT/TauT family transport system substrate-binding protein